MIPQIFNWRSGLALVAIAIASGTIFYSNYLASKIAREERKKVNVWVQSMKTRAESSESATLALTNIIANENNDIPIIETDENDRPSGVYLNLDSAIVATDSQYLTVLVRKYRLQNPPLMVEVSSNPRMINKYYYGDSKLLREVQYYPLVQLFIISLFIFITIIAITQRNRSTQNQVWVGMAKETAHQLGTPISSLEAWVEMLKEQQVTEKIALEIGKDVKRLKLVSDRFGKIGSAPHLEPNDLLKQVEEMLAYIKKRAPDTVSFSFTSDGKQSYVAPINPPLFDWVMENLLKNALDAVEGKGVIGVKMQQLEKQIVIDVSDNGKGISPRNLSKVFKPGFSTKKRGWGLGLSLSKRIMEQYHKGELFVRHSELGKGTSFRIILKTAP